MTSKKIKLNEIAKFNQNNYKTSMDWDYISYLDTGNLTENKITDIQKLELKNDKIPSRAKRIPSKNNILYSSVRPNKKHYGFIDNEVVPNLIVSTGFVVIEVDETKANSKYIYYYLTQNSVIGMLQSIGETSTSTYPSIKPSDLENIELHLPSVLEQIKIANVLSSLDNKIENNNAIIANLEEQAQTIFKSWFVDFEPFQGEEFIESELGSIPKEWGTTSLENFVEIKYGKDHKKLADGSYPVYGSGGVMRYAEDYLYNYESVLVPRKGTLNNVIYVNQPFWSVDTMFYTIMKKKNIAKFIYLFLNRVDLKSMNVGSAVPSMTTKLLNNMKVINPTEKILMRFESVVCPMFKMKNQLQSENNKLAEIRDTLLPKLMSGEIRVEDAIEMK